MRRRIASATTACLALGIGLAIGIVGVGKTAAQASEEDSGPAKFHSDAEEILDATRDVLSSLLLDNGDQARVALDRIHAQLRSLEVEDRELFGSDIVRYSKPVIGTVNIARETATSGDIERAFVEFVSIQKACRICHGLARQQGLIAEKGVE
jgi:hypothetical protein